MALDTLKILRVGLQVTQIFAPKVAGNVGARLFLTPFKVKRPQWEIEVLEGATSTGKFEGCRYWVFGDHGPAVLCIHGWSGRGSQFGKFIPPMLKQGLRVIVFDGPAHGDSRGRIAHARMFADWCIKFSKKHGPFYGLVGHSFGGNAAVLALSRGLEVERVVLIATPGDLHEIFDGFSRRLGFSPSAKSFFYKSVQRTVGLPIERVSPMEIAGELRASAVLLHDPGDREVSISGVEQLARVWPGARLVPIKGAGHYKILKNQQAIEETVKGLA